MPDSDQATPGNSLVDVNSIRTFTAEDFQTLHRKANVCLLRLKRIMRGALSKEGQMFKSWKKRDFVDSERFDSDLNSRF